MRNEVNLHPLYSLQVYVLQSVLYKLLSLENILFSISGLLCIDVALIGILLIHILD